jgi:hypothetical protein
MWFNQFVRFHGLRHPTYGGRGNYGVPQTSFCGERSCGSDSPAGFERVGIPVQSGASRVPVDEMR